MRPRSPYDPPATPGEVVRRAREQAYLSQAQLAHRAGLTASTLSRLESGARTARWDLLERLLAALDLQPVLACEAREEHLRRRVAAEAGRSAQEWFDDLVADGPAALRLALALPAVIDGTLAARLLGVPLPVDDIEVVVLREVARSVDVEALAWNAAALPLRPHDAGWRSPRPERAIVLRVVDELPALTRVTPQLVTTALTPPGTAIDVVALAQLRLTPDERRLFVHALQWRDDAS
jgi:transcriptional regulator with XRE-family HTH domain